MVIESNVVRRADLEALPVSFPYPFLVESLAPYFRRDAAAGTLYYQALRAAPAAQYGRDTAALAEITPTVIAATTTTWAGQECRARIEMSYDQVRGYYSQEGADIAMARMAKRAFYLKLEVLCAKALLESATPVNGQADPIGVIDAQCAKLRDKAYGIGEVALTMSHSVFAALKANQAIIERMKATGVIAVGLEPRYISQEQMAAVFGVDKVLVGMDTVWRFGIGGAYRGNVALSVLPSKEVDCAEEPQWARTIYFDWGSEAEHYILEEFHNQVLDAWVMDAKGIIDFKILNASMAVPIQIYAGGDSSSSN